MKTLKKLVLLAPIIAVAALGLGCSRQTLTAPQRSSAVDALVYRSDGVGVYRSTDPNAFIVVHARFVVADDGGTQRFLTYDAAAKELADDAVVRVVQVTRVVRGSTADQARGAAAGRVPQVDFEQSLAHPNAEEPCVCECCVKVNGVCTCSWGCLKVCYRSIDVE